MTIAVRKIAVRKIVVSFVTLLSLSTLPAATVAAKTSIGKVSNPLTRMADGQYTLGLNVSGQALNLILQPGSVVGTGTRIVNLNGYPQKSSFRSFQGHLHGDEKNWARISIHGDTLSGVISKQGNRYQLGGSATSLVTLKLLSEQNTHSLTSHATQLRQTKTLSTGAASASVSHVVDLAIAVDSQYNDLYNGHGLEKALSIINSVDGIYREEFGISLRVVSALNVTDRNNDPFNFGNVTIETMLRGLRAYRMQSNQFNDASLVHLFTGNQNTDAPVGLAWINTACRTDGYDVGLSTPYRHEILLAAHEVAHNLGAEHDSETACSIENDKVMWPYISSNTSQNFSSCTRNSVRQSLQNSCHVKTIDLQVSLAADDAQNFTATVRNNDTEQSSTSSTLTIDLPANTIATALDGDCAAPDNQMKCTIGTLLPGGENQVRLNLQTSADTSGNTTGTTEQSIEGQPIEGHSIEEQSIKPKANSLLAYNVTATIASNDLPDLATDNNTASLYKIDTTLSDQSEFDDGADSAVTPQQPSDTGGGANSGSNFVAGIGSTDLFLLALGLIPVAMRRR
jgi:hypothetical protein